MDRRYSIDRRKYAAALSILCMGLMAGCSSGAETAVDTEGQSVAGVGQESASGDNAAEKVSAEGASDQGGASGQEAQTENSGTEGNAAGESASKDSASGNEKAGESAAADAAQEERKLTQEELKEYTDWLNQKDNYGFLLSEWSSPYQINLWEVFYNGAGISQQATEEQKQLYLLKTGQEEIYTDFWVIYYGKVNELIEEKLGLSYDELTSEGNLSFEEAYLTGADCFAMEVGDTNYTQFEAVSGTEDAEGIVTLQYRNAHAAGETVAWVEAGEVKLKKESRQFVYNHITEGMILEADDISGDSWVDSEGLVCLIPEEIFANLNTDADASAVEHSYVLGDWSKITKEALQGTWYHHPSDAGDSTRYDVILQFDEDDAVVYYPAVDFYGDTRYEWEIIDRSGRGLCPELAIYYGGRSVGPLAWYILGISDSGDYFWCNGEVFYRQ